MQRILRDSVSISGGLEGIEPLMPTAHVHIGCPPCLPTPPLAPLLLLPGVALQMNHPPRSFSFGETQTKRGHKSKWVMFLFYLE